MAGINIKPKVFVSEPINEKGLALLEGHASFIFAPDTTKETAIKLVADADAAILRATTIFDRSVIEAGKRLKVIARTGVGYNNVDLEAADECGIYVCTTPGTNNRTVAEHTIAMIFALAKQVGMMDSAVREGHWLKRFSSHQIDLHQKMLGLIGMGAIGQCVAQMAIGMGMQVQAFDPYYSGGVPGVIQVDELDRIFEASDFLSLHCPSTPKTRHLINAETLGRMKPSAYLINTSRGDLVNEQDLTTALQKGVIRGAAIDVFTQEPPLPSSPLLQLPNVIVSPHVAGSTVESNERIAMMAAQAVKDVLDDLIPKAVVNAPKLKVQP